MRAEYEVEIATLKEECQQKEILLQETKVFQMWWED
jgi:hypothetical protein